MVLPTVSRTLLRDEAYSSIRAAIVSGALAPGAPLRDGELAERLGFSRAPVRDALTRLAEDGLVESKPQSYTRVAPLLVRDVRDAVAVVRAMHELATREAVPHLGRPELAAMRAASAAFAAAVRAGHLDAALAEDDALLGVLVVACGNRAVAATIARNTPAIRRLERRKFADLSGRDSARMHDRLIHACAAGDVEAAVAVTAETWSTLDALLAGDDG